MTHAEITRAFRRIQRVPRATHEAFYAGSGTIAKISTVPAVIGGDLYKVTVLRWDIDGYYRDGEACVTFGKWIEATEYVYSLAPDLRRL